MKQKLIDFSVFTFIRRAGQKLLPVFSQSGRKAFGLRAKPDEEGKI
ncbi:MAG: hypothetical protein ACOYIF_09565 [Acetivibrionales bacterium]